MKKIIMLILMGIIGFTFYSCSDNAVTTFNQIFNNKVAAKNRLTSADSQAKTKYGPSAVLVLVFGKNVIFDGTNNGTTDISLYSGITDPNNIGAWLYFFKKPGTDTLAVYTPNPTPGATNCIELTSIFNFNTLLTLIQDTSAKNIVSGALSLINSSSFKIKTSLDSLVDSDNSYGYSYSYNPVIKFDASFIPSQSTNNGSTFFTTGTEKSVNMFLIPALGTLNFTTYIPQLIQLPLDLWVVNYKKRTNKSPLYENLILGTVVRSNQNMGITIPPGFTSKVINISKY